MMEHGRPVADDPARTASPLAPHPSPGTAHADVECAGLSHTGMVRSQNEDHFVIASMRKTLEVRGTNLDDVTVFNGLQRAPGHLFVVADGVGGRVGGRLASGLAIQTILEYLGEVVGCYQRMDVDGENEFLEQLTRAVERSHDRIQHEFGGESGPATTLTMVALLWPRAYFVHVGDSRAYLLRKGRLRQFTQDQTMGDVMVDIGVMTEESARKGGLFNILASSVGGDLSPSVGLIDLEPDDMLLLCTDGLTRHLSDARLTEILTAAPSAAASCQSLVDAALHEGGKDNITTIVVRCARD